MQLADLGAEVIKVEDPSVGGDVGRYVPPYQEGEDSLFFETLQPQQAQRLARPAPPRRTRRVRGSRRVGPTPSSRTCAATSRRSSRLRYDDLAHVNPRIVCCSLSGFGDDRARARRRARTTTRSRGSRAGRASPATPDEPPTKSGLSLVDFCGGYVAAIAILAGVWRARRDGRGGDIDLSLFEVALAQLNYIGTWVASRGYEPVRRANSAHQSMVPFQNFATRDGWLVVACPKQALWLQLCAALGRAGARLDDERFATFARPRRATATSCSPMLEPIFRARDHGRVARGADRGRRPVRAGERRRRGARRRAGQRARTAWSRSTHPVLGAVRAAVRARSAFDGTSSSPRPRAARMRGEHTAAVAARALRLLPTSGSSELAAAGVFGDVRDRRWRA